MFGISSGVNVWIFLKSLGIGFVIALLYGLFILIRRLGLRNPYLVFFQDVLFSLSAAAISFVFCYVMNAGIPRTYIFFGETVGFFLFFLYKIPFR